MNNQQTENHTTSVVYIKIIQRGSGEKHRIKHGFVLTSLVVTISDYIGFIISLTGTYENHRTTENSVLT